MAFHLLEELLQEIDRRAIERGADLDQLPVDIERIMLHGGIAFFACIPVYMVSFYMFLRRLWEEIPSEFARTTPGKAAGFMFIPLWNVYWMFVAFSGLYKDMNRATESRGLASRFDEERILLTCGKWVFLLIGFVCLSICTEIFGDGRLLFWGSFGFSVVYAWVTIKAYWFIRKDVLEFIDIKASTGDTRAADASPPVNPNQQPVVEKTKNLSKPVVIAGVSVVAALCLAWFLFSGNSPTSLAGKWGLTSGYFAIGNIGPIDNMELFKDGTGIARSESISWKVENGRLVLAGARGAGAFDYEISLVPHPAESPEGFAVKLTLKGEWNAEFMKLE